VSEPEQQRIIHDLYDKAFARFVQIHGLLAVELPEGGSRTIACPACRRTEGLLVSVYGASLQCPCGVQWTDSAVTGISTAALNTAVAENPRTDYRIEYVEVNDTLRAVAAPASGWDPDTLWNDYDRALIAAVTTAQHDDTYAYRDTFDARVADAKARLTAAGQVPDPDEDSAVATAGLRDGDDTARLKQLRISRRSPS
jgi:hypothetical protein